MDAWDDVEELLTDMAGLDLSAGEDMSQPCLAAYTGDEPLFIAFLRDFRKGEYQDPIIELLALATPLGADRLAFAITARVWSLEDPIPPVAEGVDLRQRALMIELADGVGEHVTSRTVLVPFDDPVPGEAVRWGTPHVETAGTRGWISWALGMAVTRKAREELATEDAGIAEQAARLDRLGHTLYLVPEVTERLLNAVAAADRPLPGTMTVASRAGDRPRPRAARRPQRGGRRRAALQRPRGEHDPRA
jgi:hypothetical protein